MSDEVNLHELAKLPFGEATKELQKRGLWNENHGKELKKFKVKCSVTFTTTEQEVTTVEAYDEEEAMDKAEEEFLYDPDVESAEAISAVEL